MTQLFQKSLNLADAFGSIFTHAWEEVVDCIEVSTAELAASEGAWLVSTEDSPGFLFFLMAASSAAPLPPTNSSD